MPYINSPSGGAAVSLTPADGWVVDNNVPVYASATTFTAGSTDLTATYKPGTLIKLTQTTVKYFVVASSSFGAGTTTVTVANSSDYSLANAAITSPYYSYVANPQGFPTWFNFAPTFGGYATTPSSVTCQFAVQGRICYFTLTMGSTNTTSNATTLTFTLPFAAAIGVGCMCTGKDNGTFLTGACMIQTTALSATCGAYKDGSSAAWTAANSKLVSNVVLAYPF